MVGALIHGVIGNGYISDGYISDARCIVTGHWAYGSEAASAEHRRHHNR